jgi:hypothetical protein
MLNFGEIFSETHIVANTRSWSFIVEKLQRNSFSIISDAKLQYSMIWGRGTGKMVKELYPELIMVINSNNHLSSLLLWQRVKCAAKHIYIKVIRCKGESPESY